MVEFEDPITDTEYDFSDPAGTGMKVLTVLGGIAMTLVLFVVAQENIVPRITSALSGLTGTDVGGTGSVEVV